MRSALPCLHREGRDWPSMRPIGWPPYVCAVSLRANAKKPDAARRRAGCARMRAPCTVRRGAHRNRMETTGQEILPSRQVREVMTGRPATVRLDEGLGRARQIMTRRGVRHLPVMRGDSVEGMISDRDILAAA